MFNEQIFHKNEELHTKSMALKTNWQRYAQEKINKQQSCSHLI